MCIHVSHKMKTRLLAVSLNLIKRFRLNKLQKECNAIFNDYTLTSDKKQENYSSSNRN